MLYKEIREEEEMDCLRRWDLNCEQVEKIDEEAKKTGSILHRFIYEPYADGKAVYQVVKLNKKTVRLKVVKGIGDDWVLPWWGEEILLVRSLIEEKIRDKDNLYSLLRNQNA